MLDEPDWTTDETLCAMAWPLKLYTPLLDVNKVEPPIIFVSVGGEELEYMIDFVAVISLEVSGITTP